VGVRRLGRRRRIASQMMRSWPTATALLVFAAASAGCDSNSRDGLAGSVVRAVAGTEHRDWASLQPLGGLRVLDPVRLADGTVLLPVAFDISGLTSVTTTPRTINSGSVVVRTDAAVTGDHIRLGIIQGLAGERGLTCFARSAKLGDLVAGDYAVEYENADGTTVPLRTVHVSPPDNPPVAASTRVSWTAVPGSWLDASIAPADRPPPGVASAGSFSPTADEVRRAEQRIIETLLLASWKPDCVLLDLPAERRDWFLAEIAKIAAHLDGFSAQVAGLVVDGHRRLFFNVLARDILRQETKLAPLEDWYFFFDGGWSLWRIQYDLDDDRCLAFDSNGYA